MRWLDAEVDLLLWHDLFCLFSLLLGHLIVNLATDDFLHTMSVICMVRVRWVEERELGVLTLVLADLVLEERRVGGTGDEGRGTVNDGCVDDSR